MAEFESISSPKSNKSNELPIYGNKTKIQSKNQPVEYINEWIIPEDDDLSPKEEPGNIYIYIYRKYTRGQI